VKSINQVTLLGNLTRDLELRYTPNGNAVINFSMATNRSYKDKATEQWKDIAEFHNVVFWGKPAEIISQYCSKGDKLLVQGRMQTRSWEDKTGVKKYTTEVVGRDFILLTPKGSSTEKVSQPPAEVKKESKADSDIEKKAELIFGVKAKKESDPADDFIEHLEKEKANKEKGGE